MSPLCVLINSIDLTFSPRVHSDCLFTIRGRLSRLLNSPPPSAYKQWNHQLGNKSGDSSSIPLWEVSNNQPCWSQAGCRQIQARGIDGHWLPSISLYLLAGKSAALCVPPLPWIITEEDIILERERGGASERSPQKGGRQDVFFLKKKRKLCWTLVQNEVWSLHQKCRRMNLLLFISRNIGDLFVGKKRPYSNIACAIVMWKQNDTAIRFRWVMEGNRETLSILCVNLNMVTFYTVHCLTYLSSWWYWHTTMIDYNSGWPIHIITLKQWITARFTASVPGCFL